MTQTADLFSIHSEQQGIIALHRLFIFEGYAILLILSMEMVFVLCFSNRDFIFLEVTYFV